jgi:hypothetical protein
MTRIITCAALYFQPQTKGVVPWSWVEGAARILAGADLPVQEFAITTATGFPDGQFDLSQNRDILVREVRRGNVSVLGLYSNPEKDHDLVMDWQGLAYIDLIRGDCFLGLPRSIEPSPSALIQSALTLGSNVINADYGIAYYHDSSRGPDMFAVGIIVNPIAFDAETMAAGDRVAKWFHEMSAPRRHLQGWFRAAYPANILSRAHVEAPISRRRTLFTAGIGRLTPVAPNLWLWELSDQEIPAAEATLRDAGLLIC